LPQAGSIAADANLKHTLTPNTATEFPAGTSKRALPQTKAHMNDDPNSPRCFGLLSRLVLGHDETLIGSWDRWNDNFEKLSKLVVTFKESDWKTLQSLANSHHVVLRGLPRLLSLPVAVEYGWIGTAIETEQARIERALSFLAPICEALENAGPVVVIKSLDHWPDLGSDLDLYTQANARDVVGIMRDRFRAQVAKQSWGDRMANKWNFEVPGLPEPIEVHVRRLGQMGEQRLIGDSLVARSLALPFGAYRFQVPSAEDRMILSTLQRMFRHFYIRLCDIVDLSQSLERGGIDFDYLRSLAKVTGLWPGLATYLKIVSDYVRQYRGKEAPLPEFLLAAARFGNEKVRFGKEFLRIPIVPHSAGFYAAELKELLWSGEIADTLRLGLLPFLATMAAVEYRITGSDKGIW
jgi:hypothetical protein